MVVMQFRGRMSFWFSRFVSACVLPLLLMALPVSAVMAVDASSDQHGDGAIVMEVFNEQALAKAEAYELSDERKHQILFVMGVALLVLLGLTAYFGIALGIGGKDVFVPHMVSAGLTITLSLAHAVTAVVWFFPF